MKGDKRKGLLSGYKKAGPTLRFTIIVAALSLIFGGIYFLVQLWTGATKDAQDQAQVDRDIKHKEQLAGMEDVKDIIRDSLNTVQPNVRERPYVFFKMTKLVMPLAAGEKPTVEFILANSGQMEAIGFIRDITYFFDIDPVEERYEYQNTEPISFSLAPTAEWNGQLRRFSFVLTKEKIKAIKDGRARLFFFAHGEYKDSLGRVYPLPFCRMYDKDMPSNLIICPDQMTIKQKEKNGDR